MLRFFLSSLVLLGLDHLWIAYLAKPAYFKAYGHVLRLAQGQLQPMWWAVVVVYLALIGGLNFFVFSDRLGSNFSIISQAFIFGIVVYAVYDFTCLALFKNWPLMMSIIDTLWGGLLCALTALVVLGLEKLID
jgi:uncharacterized membrane protein